MTWFNWASAMLASLLSLRTKLIGFFRDIFTRMEWITIGIYCVLLRIIAFIFFRDFIGVFQTGRLVFFFCRSGIPSLSSRMTYRNPFQFHAIFSESTA